MLSRIRDIKINYKLLGIISIIAFFGVTATAGAQTAQRSNLQQKLNQIQQQINQYQQQISKTHQQEASLGNEISIYDDQISSLELQIQANETQKQDTDLQIGELQTQIDRRKAEIDENKKLLAQLIIQLSQLDENSYLNISLGTDNFSAFLDQVQYTRSLQTQVYSLVNRIKEIKSKLELQQQDLKAQLAKIVELKDQLAETQTSLDSQKASKESLLSSGIQVVNFFLQRIFLLVALVQ